MKRTYWVMTINIILAIIFSVLFSLMMGEVAVFLVVFGAVSGIMGLVNLLIGLIYIPIGNHEMMKALLISSGVLFLLGIGVCGSMFVFMVGN